MLISFLKDLDQVLSFFNFCLLPFTVNSSFFLSSRSNHLPPQASSSSFTSHGQIIYPPQAPISTTRIKTHQHHKNQNPQARTPLIHKHRSPPPTSIHKHQNPFLSTHKHRSLPPTPIHKHLDPFLISYCSEHYFSFSLLIPYFQFDFFSLRFNSSTLGVNHHSFVKFPNQTYMLKTFQI